MQATAKDLRFFSREILDTVKAMFYVEQHFPSHSIQLADALIAATAQVHAFPVLTGNDKHYRALKGFDIKKFRP